MEELNAMGTIASKGGRNDPEGYWWPPTYSIWSPTIVSFSFPVSLIVAQFIIFGSFRVLNFWIRFEAPNDVFFGIEWLRKYESILDLIFVVYGCSP